MKKFGFTLAEVLITLAIIGVVAALTIPTLITNYQKRQYVTGLQKSYAQIQNLFKLVMANDSVDTLEQTKLIQSISGEGIYTYAPEQQEFVTELSKYLKITKACLPMDFDNICHQLEYKNLNSNPQSIDDTSNRGGNLQIFTADGMIYYFDISKNTTWSSEKSCNETKANGGNKCSDQGEIRVDVNGSKGPNEYGRDMFVFDIDGYGTVYLRGAINAAGKSFNWQDDDRCNPSRQDYGDGCAARIFEQGWKMDY